MKRIRSFTNVWSVEKVIYAVNDLRLPFPVTFSQMAWFVVTFLLVLMLADVPPLSFIQGALLKYVGIPVGITLFMSKKTFDGKKPYSFLKSVILYACRPKRTYAGTKIKLGEQAVTAEITAVRREFHAKSD